MLSSIRKLSAVLEKVITGIAASFLGVITVLVFVMVITRYLFGFVFTWAEELSLFLICWSALLGAGVVQRRKNHIAVNYFFDKIPCGISRFIKLFFSVLILIYLGVLTRYAFRNAVMSINDTTSALRISMFWPYSSIFVTSGLMAFFELCNFVEELAGTVIRKE